MTTTISFSRQNDACALFRYWKTCTRIRILRPLILGINSSDLPASSRKIEITVALLAKVNANEAIKEKQHEYRTNLLGKL